MRKNTTKEKTIQHRIAICNDERYIFAVRALELTVSDNEPVKNEFWDAVSAYRDAEDRVIDLRNKLNINEKAISILEKKTDCKINTKRQFMEALIDAFYQKAETGKYTNDDIIEFYQVEPTYLFTSIAASMTA